MRTRRPPLEAQRDASGYITREWSDFFLGIWNALGYVGRTLMATATLDFPSISAGGTQTLTVTVTGASVNDEVTLGPPSTLDSGIIYDAHVTAANTVTVRATNITTGAINPASSTWRVIVRTT